MENMRLLVEISERTLDRMRSVVDHGRYSSVQRFVQLAIENQLGLEEVAEERRLLRVPEARQVSTRELSDSDVLRRKNRENVLEFLSIPETDPPEGLDPHGADEIGFTPESGDWIWGQINNCLAVKLATRILLREMLREDGPPSLSRIQSRAGPVATELGDLLRDLDDASDRNRVHRWSKSFPTSEANSQRRFLGQYFGHVRSGGGVRGALPELGLARLIDDGAEPRVGLTEVGLQMAVLENPLLDAHPAAANDKLSAAEKAHYTNSVVSTSIKELEAITSIGRVLLGAQASAHELWSRLSDQYPDWSEKEVLTYGNGAVSRMSDVDLLRRIDPGTSAARFEPTDTLRELLS